MILGTITLEVGRSLLHLVSWFLPHLVSLLLRASRAAGQSPWEESSNSSEGRIGYKSSFQVTVISFWSRRRLLRWSVTCFTTLHVSR